jgi:hypothetical protein
MPIELSMEMRDGYLRFDLTGKRVVGEFAVEMLKIWERIAKECEASGATRMLGVSHLTGPARLADVYESAASGCAMLLTSRCRKVAFAILGGGDVLEQNRLGESMAALRGLDVRMFSSEAAALEWLLQ